MHGSVVLTVEAYDRPQLASPAPWLRMPVAPAIVGWRMTTLAGKAVVPGHKIVDFTRGLPPQSSFWTVYARGTYQNNPRFNRQVYLGLPGCYVFNLTPAAIDTHQFPNGIYQLTASAYDARGHRATLTTQDRDPERVLGGTGRSRERARAGRRRPSAPPRTSASTSATTSTGLAPARASAAPATVSASGLQHRRSGRSRRSGARA